MTKFVNDILLQELRQYCKDIIISFLDPVKHHVIQLNKEIDKMKKWFDCHDGETKERNEEFERIKKGIKESQIFLEKEIDKIKKMVKK